jgi:copper oxidase (laccase) domain-containing protein
MNNELFSDLTIAISNVADGSMTTTEVDEEIIRKNRTDFLRSNSISIDDTVLVRLDYNSNDFTRYDIVDTTNRGEGMTRSSMSISDARFTRDRQVALFLPLADCIGAVLYDAKQQVIGLSHLGRHNLVQNGGKKSIEYMVSTFGSLPRDIMVYVSPAADKEHYPLFDFDNRSMHSIATEQLLAAGIVLEHIVTDKRDTTTDDDLFSHSNYLASTQVDDGRHAIVVMIK